MEFKSSEIVVEIDHPKNSDVSLTVGRINLTLRSRFIPYRSGPTAPGPLSDFQSRGIPGQFVCLDVGNRSLRIIDGLEDESVLERVNYAARQLHASGKLGTSSEFSAVKRQEFESLSDEEIATVQFWMRHWLDGKKTMTIGFDAKSDVPRLPWCRDVQNCNKLPSERKLRESGKVQRTIMDNRTKIGPVIDVPEHMREQKKEAKTNAS